MVATSSANARRGRLLQRLAIGLTAVTLIAGVADGGRLATTVARAAGMDEVLAGRSPGERLAAELTKTKRMAAAAPQPERTARALPRVRTPAAEAVARPAAALPGAPDLFGPALLDQAPVPPVFAGGFLPAPGPGGFYSGPSFLPAPGIGGGGIGGGGGGGGLLPGPGETPVVPEPATWLLMILGFGALGFRMRQRRVRAFADAR